jgi:hypothetical protein
MARRPTVAEGERQSHDAGDVHMVCFLVGVALNVLALGGDSPHLPHTHPHLPPWPRATAAWGRGSK